MKYKIMPETAMPTVNSALIKNRAICLNVYLMKFHITVGGKLSKLSKAGSRHFEPQLLTGNLLPWASIRSHCGGVKKKLKLYIYAASGLTKQNSFLQIWLSSTLA